MINHTRQAETSHFIISRATSNKGHMNMGEIFRQRIREEMARQDLTPAGLSVMAGLNRRAISDILEREGLSPKASTCFAIADALGVNLLYLFGKGPRHQLSLRVQEFLAEYPEEDQLRFLAAVQALNSELKK